ncbi:Glycosyltransferase, GT2 family [Nocardioides scoriae]|uniref:Glycosyltransferase, GT2 family n=1 Tax=Nocardioides scoriae TaxID=642780 RepID=A0A1H1V8F5_9ACTN|nr:glycosyltransferase [Nocardioides scoriae]SDS80920.1 Glycosyltransferase, GT2 family [Nocardioides scoriae]
MRPPWGLHLPGNGWDVLADREPPVRTTSVVVTHFEQPDELARTLHALTRQTLPPDEVVVADDGSREPPRVPRGTRLVRQDDQGFRAAAARDLGAAAATGDVLVFLDADTTPEPGLVEALTCLPRLQPDVLVVGRRRHADLTGVPVDADVEEAGPAHELPEPGWLRDAYAASRDLLDADDLSSRFVISAVLACSRWWYDEVGGFDRSFTAYGGEDWELAHRSWLAGGLVAHAPDAVAWHDGPDAGAVPRGSAAVESAELAARVGVPGLAPHGLLGLRGRPLPVDRLLAPSPDLDPRELLLVVDAALHADPQLHVAVDDDQAALLAGEPRLLRLAGRTALEAALASPARRLVELHRPRLLAPQEWRDLLLGATGDPARLRLGDLATATSLRLVRRARRHGADPDEVTVATERLGGTPLPDGLTLGAWWGGWAAGAPRTPLS